MVIVLKIFKTPILICITASAVGRYSLGLVGQAWSANPAVSAMMLLRTEVSRSMCYLPVLSSLPICSSPSPSAPALVRADFPQLLQIQSVGLDDLIGQSASRTDLAVSIRHTQYTVKDIIHDVKASNMTFKVALVEALETYAKHADATGQRLLDLSSMIYATLDE